MNRRWLIGVMMVAILGAFAFHQGTKPRGSEAPPQAASPITSMRQNKVGALGRLTPASEMIAIGAASNERLGQLLVQVGQSVQKGEILAYLESYAERLAAQQYAESQLHDARTRLMAETTYGEAQIAEVKLRIQHLQHLPRLDIRAQEARLRQLVADLEVAKADLARVEGLRGRGAISQQDVEHQRLQVRRYEEEHHSESARLAKLKAEASDHLLMAQAELTTVQANLARTQASAQLDVLQQNLELTQAQLARTILRAPIAGRILDIMTRPGEVIGARPLLHMADTRQMMVVAEVYETDIGRVRVGQRANVSSPALADTLTGSVVHVGGMIAKNSIRSVDPTAATDTRVVEVKIQLDESEPASQLIHLQVDVDISLLEMSEKNAHARGH